ncbi:MAG: DUF1543 domain-containing protein [Pseudomonadota bacterium]
MDKLYVVIVGGYPPGAHTEIHDVRFAVGRTLKDLFPKIKAEWWGGDDRFHFDAWGALEWADGHRIVIADTAPDDARTDCALWFVNLGGYRSGHFGELHKDVFVVARTQTEAKKRALAQAKAEGWDSAHRDTLMSVEAIVDVGAAAGGRIYLVPSTEKLPFTFEAKYLPKVS